MKTSLHYIKQVNPLNKYYGAANIIRGDILTSFSSAPPDRPGLSAGGGRAHGGGSRLSQNAVCLLRDSASLMNQNNNKNAMIFPAILSVISSFTWQNILIHTV